MEVDGMSATQADRYFGPVLGRVGVFVIRAKVTDKGTQVFLHRVTDGNEMIPNAYMLGVNTAHAHR